VQVSATKAKVAVLFDNALLYQRFRETRHRPLDPDAQDSIRRVATALSSSTANNVDVDQHDLTAIHALSDSLQKAHPGRFRIVFQVHCIASFLSAAMPLVLLNPAILIAAPIIVPYCCIGAPLFHRHPFYLGLAMHFAIRYACFLVPSYFIARDLRFREFTKWAYIAVAAILAGHHLYFYLAP
jgi:hypothetical protein